MANYPDAPRNNFIDELVFAKLKRLNIVHPLFLRTRNLSAESISTQSACCPRSRDPGIHGIEGPAKRTALIDALVERPEFSEVWATKFSDLFRVGLLDQAIKAGAPDGITGSEVRPGRQAVQSVRD